MTELPVVLPRSTIVQSQTPAMAKPYMSRWAASPRHAIAGLLILYRRLSVKVMSVGAPGHRSPSLWQGGSLRAHRWTCHAGRAVRRPPRIGQMGAVEEQDWRIIPARSAAYPRSLARRNGVLRR